jgi:L-ascorbate metabolism protein UlaG (beta-lactamase superfamily)
VADVGPLEIVALPAYNTNKVDSEGRPFHVLGSETVGYVIRDGGRRIYHSGDTDVIPEMDEAAGVDVALLPVSGTYVMTPIEAAEAARRIDPGVAVPMHWGTVIGSRADAEEFVSAAPVEARILDSVAEEA